jgi:hypothetical protein
VDRPARARREEAIFFAAVAARRDRLTGPLEKQAGCSVDGASGRISTPSPERRALLGMRSRERHQGRARPGAPSFQIKQYDSSKENFLDRGAAWLCAEARSGYLQVRAEFGAIFVSGLSN